MKQTVENLNNFYKIVIVAPAMIGLGALVLYGLFVFALDKNNKKG